MQILSTDPNRPGIFAVGQEAVGVFALGQTALGVVAIGQLARGVFCVGQGAIGVLALGQGSIGLLHGTGMMGVAGSSGYGLVLHLLPKIVREPPPELPPTSAAEDLLDRSLANGWLDVAIRRGPNGATLVPDGAIPLDARDAGGMLDDALDAGCERARILVHAEVSIDGEASYRSAESHTVLVCDRIMAYTNRPKRYLAYAKPPRGQAGARAGGAAIALRSLGWLVAVAVVTIVSFGPLVSALVDAPP